MARTASAEPRPSGMDRICVRAAASRQCSCRDAVTMRMQSLVTVPCADGCRYHRAVSMQGSSTSDLQVKIATVVVCNPASDPVCRSVAGTNLQQ